MSGDGTQESPYLVETWEELLSVATSSSVYIKAANEQIIDFNNIVPDGYSSTVSLRGKEIDLEGWTLLNFRSTAQYALQVYSGCTYYNLVFENFYHHSSVNSTQISSFLRDDSKSSGTIIFNDCYFRGREVCDDSPSYFAYCLNNGGYQYVFNRCVFIIKATSGFMYTFMKGQSLNLCNSLLDIKAGIVRLFPNNDSFNYSYSMSSKFFGGIEWTSEKSQDISSTWKDGVYINYSNGQEVSNSSYSTYKIEVDGEQKYIINFGSNSNYKYITFFDENDVFINGYRGQYTNEYLISTPNNTKYLYVSVYNSVTISEIRSFPNTITSYLNNRFICGSSHSGWNIFDLDLGESCTYIYTGIQMSIYNKDKFNHDVSSTKLIGCTNAQINDGGYLSTIGFPIDDGSITISG